MNEVVDPKMLESLTVVPSKFRVYFGDDIEAFKSELLLSAKNFERTEELMAKMFVDQTEASMKAIRQEMAEIRAKMNGVMASRFKSGSVLNDMTAVVVWGKLMGAFSDRSHLTDEQRKLLEETGAFHDLMYGKSA